MTQTGFTKIIIVLMVIVVIGLICYFVLTSKQPTSPKPEQQKRKVTEELEKEKMTEISVSPKPISGSHPKFSHDGTKIVYRRIKTGNDGLWVVNMDGSGLKKLTSEEPSGEGTFDFGWSYDDNFIFYVVSSESDKRAELKIVNVNTGDIQTLFEAPQGFGIKAPRWLGQYQVAFILHDALNPSVASVKVVDVRGESVEPLEKVILYFWLTKESPESSVIASVDTAGEVRELTPGGAFSVPSVGPRAAKIAYSNLQGIVVMDGNGDNAKMILSNPGGGAVPLFSPDGKKLIYSKSKDDGHYITESDIYMINVDGGNEQRLTTSGEKLATEPSWSADGTKIVFFYLGDAENQIGILEVE